MDSQYQQPYFNPMTSTDQSTHPFEAPPQTPPMDTGPYPEPPPSPPVNWFAIAALVVGIVSLVGAVAAWVLPFPNPLFVEMAAAAAGLVAVGLGIVGFLRRRSKGGGGFAIAGMASGASGFLAVVAMITLFVAVMALSSPKSSSGESPAPQPSASSESGTSGDASQGPSTGMPAPASVWSRSRCSAGLA